MRDLSVLHDPLAGGQMPPDVFGLKRCKIIKEDKREEERCEDAVKDFSVNAETFHNHIILLQEARSGLFY